MQRKFVFGMVLAAATFLAFAAAFRLSDGPVPAKAVERQQYLKMMKPQLSALKTIVAASPKIVPEAKPPSTVCADFYQRVFAEDFSSIAALRMNKLPASAGCVPEKPLVKGVFENYEKACIQNAAYPAQFAQWTEAQKTKANECFLWIWFLRSSVVADQLKDQNPGNVVDTAILSQWLFGHFLEMDFAKMARVAARLVEVDPRSVLGAKAMLMKGLVEATELDDKKTGSDSEAVWADGERDWRRTHELVPDDADVDFAGVFIRTHNLDLSRLKKELQERHATRGDNDYLAAYLGAYYASKTESKEAAIVQLEAGAKRFPEQADMFRNSAEACRKQPKCEFKLGYTVRINNVALANDIVH